MNDAKQIESLRKALTPFVSVFEAHLKRSGRHSVTRREWNEKMPDQFPIALVMTMGDYREARRVLREFPK